MATMLGGACVGAGMGIVFSQGGSTGGTDIVAMIVNKFRNITPGKMSRRTWSFASTAEPPCFALVPSFTRCTGGTPRIPGGSPGGFNHALPNGGRKAEPIHPDGSAMPPPGSLVTPMIREGNPFEHA